MRQQRPCGSFYCGRSLTVSSSCVPKSVAPVWSGDAIAAAQQFTFKPLRMLLRLCSPVGYLRWSCACLPKVTIHQRRSSSFSCLSVKWTEVKSTVP